MSSSRTILVTGGAGYIGSHACKALAEAGHVPITYDNLSTGNRWAVRWGPLEIGDIHDASRLHDVFRKHRPEGVIHFAARALVGESVSHPTLYYRDNISGALSVLDAARTHDVGAFVFSSTCAVYGQPDAMPIAEDVPPRPMNPYGASKLMVERILADYHAAYGLPFMALRYFNAAGASASGEIGERRDIETHLIPLAIEAALGRRPPLTILGDDYPTPDGTPVRDYIHVEDLALAHLRALDLLLGGGAARVVNLGTGRGHSVSEVLSSIEAVSGRRVPTTVGPRRPGDPPELVAAATAARQLLGEDITARSDLANIVSSALKWHTSSFYERGLPA